MRTKECFHGTLNTMLVPGALNRTKLTLQTQKTTKHQPFPTAKES